MTILTIEENHDHPGIAGLVVDRESGARWAAILTANLLAPDRPSLPDSRPADRLIAWSGTLAQNDLFERDPATWMPAGLDAFRAMTADLPPRLSTAGVTLLFRPHARHVLCDPQRCLTMLREWEDNDTSCFGLLLDAPAMLEADMLDTAGDHLERALAALAPRAAAIALSNVRAPSPPSDPDDPPPLTPAPLEDGVLDPATIAALIRRHAPNQTPLISFAGDPEAQARILAAAPTLSSKHQERP